MGQACEAAQLAYKSWRHSSLEERKKLLLKLKELYLENKEAIATLISRETGKPYWESLGEAGALVAKIDVTLDHSLKLVNTEKVKNIAKNVDGYIRHKSRGVMAVIGPFNFPAHLANGHIIPALLTGNTIVFKPSEKTPMTGQLLASLIDQAGFPPGVFNLIQGRGDVGQALVAEERVDGVLFTGSYDVGLKIKQETLQDYWKIIALEMGGKNCSIVWEDADLEKAIYETLIGAYLTTGQRCSCTSKIILHEKIYEPFVEKFHTMAAHNLKIGHWKEDPFMGPLISEEAVCRYLEFHKIAEDEGGAMLDEGRALAGNS